MQQRSPQNNDQSGFVLGLLLYAACAAVSVWLLWPMLYPADQSYSDPRPWSESHPGSGGQRGGYSPYFPGREGRR